MTIDSLPFFLRRRPNRNAFEADELADPQVPEVAADRLDFVGEALLANQPGYLLAQDDLETVEVELLGVVACEMLALGFADFFFLAHYLAGFAVVVVFVDVELDVPLL